MYICAFNLLIDQDQQALKLPISPDDESQFGFETSMTKMTPTADYLENNFETPHHRNLKID
jgi:hypothetical protein